MQWTTLRPGRSIIRDSEEKARDALDGFRQIVYERTLQVKWANEGQAWVGSLMHTFKHDGYDQAWKQLAAQRSALRGPSKRKALDGLMQHAAERREMDPLFGVSGPELADWQRADGSRMQNYHATRERPRPPLGQPPTPKR